MAEPAAPTTAPPTSVPPTSAPQTAAPQAGDGGPGNAAFGLLADGGFVARLGAGLRLSAEDLRSPAGVDLTTLPQPVPGVRLTKAKLSARRNSLEVDASLQVPQLEAADFRINVNREGKPSFALRSLRKQLEIAALGNPQVALSLSEEGEFGGSVTIAPRDLMPRGLRSLTVTGGGTLTIQGGRFAGNVDATLAYANLGDGEVHFAINEAGRITGTGVLRVTPPFLNQVAADLALAEDGTLSGTLTVAMSEAVSPIPALSLTGGTLTVSYANGAVSGSLTDFQAAYRGLADVTASLSIANGTFSGQGNLALTVPGLKEASGTIRVRTGAVSGSMTLAASAFPEALPIKSGRITASLTEDGRIAFAGNVGVELGPAGAGQLAATYSETGELAIAATINLTIPGLQGAQVSVAYVNGDISGEAQVPIDPSLIPGLSGNATVRYQQGLWSGETEIAYSADNGKLSGRIRVTVAQTEAGALQLGGSGEVEAQIAPRLRGMLTATILPEGGVDVSGRITVTEPLELFPEAKFDKELFKYSQNIPLWAILVAVIRVRAGIRGGVGAGVFRNIVVEGSYTIGNDEADPTFSISGEMFIPAYVEAYVAFGAGLGLDVVLGSLTGGIEGVGTAGIYGAVSVVPELSYADGDWSIEGDAVLAAGARLKIGLNAWAEIEALWVTVWEETWQLGEWVWNVGPDLGLKAHMAYRFGQPGPPEIEFNSSEIDTESMIQAAIPEEGPAPSGAREALQNKAEWKGKLKEQKPAPVPPDLAAQSQAAPPPPPKPAQQPKPKRAPPAGAPSGGPGAAPGSAPPAPDAGLVQTNGLRIASQDRPKAPRADLPADPAQRLQLAVRELRSRIVRLLDDGEPEADLSRQLAVWRTEYSLRRLDLAEGRVVAGNSPDVDVVAVLRANAPALRAALAKAADRVMAHPDVVREQERILRAHRGAAGIAAAEQREDDSVIPTVATGPGPGFLGAAGALQQADRPARFGPRSTPEFSTMPFGAAVVAEQQSARGPGGVIVGRGVEPGRGRVSVAYPDLVARMRQIASAQSPPISDQHLALILRRHVRNGEMPPPFHAGENAQVLAEFGRIVFSVEVARSPTFALESGMILTLLQTGRLTFEEAFERTSVVNPMTMIGASKATKTEEAVARRTGTVPGGRAGEQVQAVVSRRTELLVRYALVEIDSRKLVFDSEQHVLEWAEGYLIPLIRERAEELFGLTERPPAPFMN